MVSKNLAAEMAAYVLAEDWKNVERVLNESAFNERMGVVVNLDNLDSPRAEVPVIHSFHLGGIGQDYINGAVISALVDLTLGLTAMKYAHKGLIATSGVHIEFARPLKGAPFSCVGKCNQKIRKKLFSEVTIFDADNKPCTYASGIVKLGLGGVPD